jgi:signal transduction histidine kinase
MTFRDLALICFAAASVIHASQTVLAARLRREGSGPARGVTIEGIALGELAFLWQFGNFLLALAASDNFDGPRSGWNGLFWTANLLRDIIIVPFPLLFSYICMHVLDGSGTVVRLLLRVSQTLRYLLWPLTGVGLVAMVAGDIGFPIPFISGDLVGQITLHVMLFYFVVFMVATAARRSQMRSSGVAALMRAYKAMLLAGITGVVVFVLMLSGYWRVPIPFLRYISLAAMLTSVPFTIAGAYRFYQYPFMDAFIREVFSGVILLAAFVAAFSVSQSVLWIVFCGVLLAYLKAPLTRWVESTFLGYKESIEEQEERIGTAIRALTQLDEFGARVSEILSKELEAEWVEIGSNRKPDAVNEFDIPGSALILSLGPRAGGRQFMSRQLRIARTATLQLSAHHHQLSRHKMKELTARAEIRALRAQINPHFLFNTLNVLANLIHSDPAKAERVTEELAGIFRYALESTRVEWVTLADEMEFLESYLAIEKARFEERLSYTFDVDAEARTLKIPPMIVQPLVENAVKHGIAPKVDGGSVKVSAHALSADFIIEVEDSGAGRRGGSRQGGTGIGLKNVRERLLQLYGEAGVLKLEDMDSGGIRATLILPKTVGVYS